MSAAAEFWQDVTDHGRAPCLLCEHLPAQAAHCAQRSVGRKDAHHVIPQQRIRGEYPRGAMLHGLSGLLLPILKGYEPPEAMVVPLDDLLGDPRNGVCLARFHHAMLENHRVFIRREWLPVDAEAFADLVGLQWVLSREYGDPPEQEHQMEGAA